MAPLDTYTVQSAHGELTETHLRLEGSKHRLDRLLSQRLYRAAHLVLSLEPWRAQAAPGVRCEARVNLGGAKRGLLQSTARDLPPRTRECSSRDKNPYRQAGTARRRSSWAVPVVFGAPVRSAHSRWAPASPWWQPLAGWMHLRQPARYELTQRTLSAAGITGEPSSVRLI